MLTLLSLPSSDPGGYRASSGPAAKNRTESLGAVASPGCPCRRSEPAPLPHHQAHAYITAAPLIAPVKAQLRTDGLQTERPADPPREPGTANPNTRTGRNNHSTHTHTHSQDLLTNHASFHAVAPGSSHVTSFWSAGVNVLP